MTQSNAHRTSLITVAAVFPLLGTLIVFTRLYIRSVVTKAFGRDDIAILAAWTTSIGFTISQCFGLRYGVGLFMSQVSPSNISRSLEATFFVELFYYFSIYLIKVSILLFYLRLVDGLWGKLYTGTLLCLGVITLHFISTLVVVFLQCRPLSYYWNSSQPGSCINIMAFFYSTNAFTIASDVIILALPIPTLVKVIRSPSEKAALVGVFGAGAVSTISSCIRIYTVRVYTNSRDPLYNAAPIGLWSFIEINLGLICASGPALKIVFMKFKDSLSSQGRSKGSRFSFGPIDSEAELGLQMPQPPPRKASNPESFYQVDPLTGKLRGCSTITGGGYPSDDEHKIQQSTSKNADIVVKTTFGTSTKVMTNLGL